MRYAQHKILVSIFDALVHGKNRDRGDAAKTAWETLSKIEAKILAEDKAMLSTKKLVILIGAELEATDTQAFYRYGAFSAHRQEILGL